MQRQCERLEARTFQNTSFLRISQGSVITVLRRGGQKYKHLRHVSFGCFAPNLMYVCMYSRV